MPITKSAKKALRQSDRRRAQNMKRKDDYMHVMKDLKRAVAAKSKDAGAILARLYKALDKAAKTNAIAKNKASRLKSRLTKLAAKASAK
ncbi:MAG: 30S ribosomal protein S20 [Candidatus Sungbacteria bacterium]|nr:30S ribosomal protein S20 [Candidatus Sungbacteria bacterium]